MGPVDVINTVRGLLQWIKRFFRKIFHGTFSFTLWRRFVWGTKVFVIQTVIRKKLIGIIWNRMVKQSSFFWKNSLLQKTNKIFVLNYVLSWMIRKFNSLSSASLDSKTLASFFNKKSRSTRMLLVGKSTRHGVVQSIFQKSGLSS